MDWPARRPRTLKKRIAAGLKDPNSVEHLPVSGFFGKNQRWSLTTSAGQLTTFGLAATGTAEGSPEGSRWVKIGLSAVKKWLVFGQRCPVHQSEEG